MSWQHGTVIGYAHCNGGGRHACAECREANNKRARDATRRRAYGQTAPGDRVDPITTLQALHHLSAMGHNTVAIERLTGLTNQHIGWLLNNDHAYVTRETHDRVLCGFAYVLRHPRWTNAPCAFIPSDRSWQQLRSLGAIGWPITDLCRHLGWGRDAPPFREVVSRDTADRIQALYDRLSGTRGPSVRAAAYAKRLGWHAPMAYDDDGHLIPEAIPNALSERRERREDRVARADEIAALTARGMSSRQIAEQLGITDRTVTRDRARKAIAS